MRPEKLYCFVNCHIEDIVDVLSMIPHIENILLETHSPARFTGKLHVGHELHFDSYNTLSLAFFAPSSFNV